MPKQNRSQGQSTLSFGPFELSLTERRLSKDGEPLELGGRAFDILIALVQRAGQVVGKHELIATVWPDTTVEEGSLRFHIASLRKALGDGASGARYVTTVYGGGYCFVAPVVRSEAQPEAISAEALTRLPRRLPAHASRIVGRDELLRDVAAQVKADRFLTIVGPGGVGKTTLAVAAGRALLAEFKGEVVFLDLAPIQDPHLVPGMIAATLGLTQSEDPADGLIKYLRNTQTLLILDSCEHVIEQAASIAERLFEDSPKTYILATSREALRVHGEHMRTLPPLDCPPSSPGLTARQVLNFPAAQLLIERVAASGYPFELNDGDSPLVAEICRKLDGIPLAIELAAGNVSAFGLHETAARLNTRIELLWKGRRTAPSRHQTLAAALDWSYHLLADGERTVLRRLSVFVGTFSLDAARAVARATDVSEDQVVTDLAGLVAKSLVAADASRATTAYRLLDTTRIYAWDKLIASGDAERTARRHAGYFLKLLELAGASVPSTADEKVFSDFGGHLGNVRAALEWSFRGRGNLDVGIPLAAVSGRLFSDLSLLTECGRWMERAIAMLDETAYGTHLEMELQVAHGISSMLSQGSNEPAGRALRRGLELASRLGDDLNELRALGRLSLFLHRAGDFRAALEYAERGVVVAEKVADPVSLAEANASLGALLHLKGDVAAARVHLEAALIELPDVMPINTMKLGHNFRSRARITLAGVAWLEGSSRQAHAIMRQAVEEADAVGHFVTACMVRVAAANILLRDGDLDMAELYAEQLAENADKHSLAPYRVVAHAVKGELLARRGQPDLGIAQLRRAVAALHELRYEWMTVPYLTAIANGLAVGGQFDEAMETVDQAMQSADRHGDLFTMPEMLRFKGSVLMSLPDPRFPQAEDHFLQSLDLAVQQGAIAWQLRTATSLARLRSRLGRHEEARAVLAPLYNRLVAGNDNADVTAARSLLRELS